MTAPDPLALCAKLRNSDNCPVPVQIGDPPCRNCAERWEAADCIERLVKERDEARAEGEREATRRWAHWRDGTQYVGSCGTTLKAALAKIDAAQEGRKL